MQNIHIVAKLWAIEIFMLKNFVKAIIVTKSLLCIVFHEPVDEISRYRTYNFFKMFFSKTFFNIFQILRRKLLIAKRCSAGQQLIYQDAIAIVIKVIRVSFALIHLRWHRMGSATDCKGPLILDIFGLAQINHGNFSI
jgi:hypothetical protein